MLEFFIPAAHAAEAASGGPFPGFDLFIIVAFAAIFYFIVWRPQSKRTKEHRELVTGLNKGDEVLTSGGMMGRIVKVDDQFVVLEVADNVELKLQKSFVTQALPKGTLKSI